jgi:hypothetical protein
MHDINSGFRRWGNFGQIAKRPANHDSGEGVTWADCHPPLHLIVLIGSMAGIFRHVADMPLHPIFVIWAMMGFFGRIAIRPYTPFSLFGR